MGEQEYRQMFGTDRESAVRQTKAELREAIRAKDRVKAKKLGEKLKKVFVGDDVMWANEVAANIMVSSVMFLLIVVMLITVLLCRTGVFQLDADSIIPMLSICVVQMTLGIILNAVFKAEKHWLKYMMNFLICVTIAVITSLMGYRAAIAFTIPTVLSVRYFSERFTKIVAGISGVFVLTSTIGSAFLCPSPLLNTLPVPAGTVITVTDTLVHAVRNIDIDTAAHIRRLVLEDYLPNLFQFAIIAFICAKVAKWGHRMIIEQASVAQEFTRVDTELKMATDIQANILPNIFPAFPERPEIDIYASMCPAKEVGGDFYDFFLIDQDHLGIVIADVSGKGVPAALFMMIGKTLIKNQAQLGISPADVFQNVNNQLCENNASGLFITAWLGILEISTGIMTCVNAGHEKPALCHPGGSYELIPDRHGFVLAGMENMKYKEYQLKLTPGDQLFVYTDGVTEATNAEEELFGEERLTGSLNRHKADSPKKLLSDVRADIDSFVGTAPQFDDITMVSLKYVGPAV